MWAALLLVGCLTACGRLGFDVVGGGGDDAAGDDAQIPTGPQPAIVQTVTLTRSVAPSVAWNGQAFAALWRDDAGTTTTYATYAVDGTLLSGPMVLAAIEGIEQVLERPGGIAVFHHRSPEGYSLALIDTAGTVTSNTTLLTTDIVDAAFNTTRNEICVSWADYGSTPRRVRASRFTTAGVKLGADLVAQTIDDPGYRPSHVGCTDDELYVLFGATDGTEEHVYYRAFTGSADLVPQTRVFANLSGQLSVHDAVLAAPNLPQPLVVFSVTMNGTGAIRVSPFDHAATTTLSGAEVWPYARGGLVKWTGQKLLVGIEELSSTWRGTLFATLSPTGALEHVPMRLGAELPDGPDLIGPSSIAYSPSGQIAVGVTRFDTLTLTSDAFIAFLDPN